MNKLLLAFIALDLLVTGVAVAHIGVLHAERSKTIPELIAKDLTNCETMQTSTGLWLVKQPDGTMWEVSGVSKEHAGTPQLTLTPLNSNELR